MFNQKEREEKRKETQNRETNRTKMYCGTFRPKHINKCIELKKLIFWGWPRG